MGKQAIQIERIKRVVVRGTNWVGDTVMTIPALRELRRALPQAHITLATRAWAAGLFADADFIDATLECGQGPKGLRSALREARAWRAQGFDLALLFQNAFGAALIAALAGIPWRIGYATDGRSALLTHPLAVPAWRRERHEVFYYLNIVAALGQLLDGAARVETAAPRLELQVSGGRQIEARAILLRHGASLDVPLVIFCPGATNSRAKRWPAASFAALGDRLIAEAGAEVALIGAREELDVSMEVSGAMRHKPVMLTGQTDLAQTAAVLHLADLLVTNDTGPAHIAAAVGCPSLVIFGPTDPTTTRPFATSAQIIRRPPDCAPCMLRDCPIDHRCMTAITPAEVYARAITLLEARTATGARFTQ